MYAITKEFTFAAAHRLDQLPMLHKCSNLHGHNYTVIVELRRDLLDENGFIVDYGDLKGIGEWLDKNWDHKFLNDKMGCPPTAENMARILYHTFKPDFPDLYSVTVKETDKTTAKYWGD